MGHIRLGRLPKTFKWKQVIEALVQSGSSLSEIVSLTSQASETVLTNSRYINGLAHCYWLFTNIAQASRQGDFVQNLNELGINISSGDSGLRVLKEIFNSASSNLKENGNISVLDQIAVDSFKNAIHKTISDEATSLFGCDIDSIQRAFKKYSTSTQVAHLGREYFSQYMYNAFSFTLEKELTNSLSDGGRFQNSQDIQEFNKRLKQYCWDVSKIVEDFSGGWYGKHSFEGDISDKKKTADFASYAITKLLSEVQRGDN
jgi:hypothetical protein